MSVTSAGGGAVDAMPIEDQRRLSPLGAEIAHVEVDINGRRM